MTDAVASRNPARASLAVAIRAHLEQSREQIMGMPRAGPSLAVEDARQFTTALYLALVDHLEGRGPERRESFIEEVLPACRTTGLSVQTMIVGVVRSYLVLVTNVSPSLARDVRDVAGHFVGEFCGHLVGDLVRVYGGA